ncbi:response regulator transcription factor [Nakamurella leprariae]|uniref:Response regulator transcription factor n=1 Tax=Nakamurella leprariae TaxID=2803911 RepID=A0A938YAM5_9ACTN|nr:response regulator transcription factor [Nakamurella leprariae]
MRVLVVEDAQRLADAIARGLRAEGMAVDVAYDGTTGHEKTTHTRYDVVVLDRDLPGMHGDEVLAELVAAGGVTRVLMLTASAGVEERVDGLALGADDYLTKPFAFPELVARVRALGRRATPAVPPVLRAGDLEVDSAKRSVARAGRSVELTRKEFGVLEVLLAAGGSVVSSEELLERVWDENADPFTTTVRVTVMTLRRKLGDPGVIDTVVGAGYRIRLTAPDPAGDAAAGDDEPAAAGTGDDRG